MIHPTRAPLLLALLLTTLCIPPALALTPRSLDKPLPVQLTLTEKSERLAGALLRYDDDSITLRTGKGERTLPWSRLAAPSHYALRAQLIDRKSAADWLELAELGMQLNLKDQARLAVTEAGRLDPATKLKGDAILRGQGASKPATGAAADVKLANKTDPAATTDATVEKFQKPTPEEDDKAIGTAQKIAHAVGDHLKIRFAEIQTPHFILFTDWDPSEFNFLKENCEGAYAAVSRQFDIPVKENVFVGKLPVFMFARHDDFRKYAATVDNFPAPNGVAGYFTSHGDGTGHMVMWKPDVQKYGVQAAKLQWAYTLTHEFTHAFVSRYRTNRNIPRWLNEGLAEVIAYNQFPITQAHLNARMRAGERFDFTSLFDDEKMPGGDMYPVMQTMVEAMIRDNRKAFLQMFNDIKDGMDPEEAMKKSYNAGYRQWEPAWRNYAKHLQTP
jgi:hypothetical protein